MIKHAMLWLMGFFYVLAGFLHFEAPAFYTQMIPPWLSWPLALVYLSGVAEVALGIAVLVPRTREVAAWGIILLLWAVFPANIYMAVSHVPLTVRPAWMAEPSALAAWLRLPLQFVLMAWAWWYTAPHPRRDP